MPTFMTLIIVLEIVAKIIWQENQIKWIQIGYWKVKLYLFSDDRGQIDFPKRLELKESLV